MPANYQSDDKNEVVKNVKVPGNHALMLIIVFKTDTFFNQRIPDCRLCCKNK